MIIFLNVSFRIYYVSLQTSGRHQTLSFFETIRIVIGGGGFTEITLIKYKAL